MDFQKTVISNTEPDRKAKVWARPTKEGADLLILDAGKWKPVMSEEIIRKIMEDIGTATEVVHGDSVDYTAMEFGKLYMNDTNGKIYLPLEASDSGYKVIELSDKGIALINQEGSSSPTNTQLSKPPVPVIDHQSSVTSLEIEPDQYHRWGEIASLTITLSGLTPNGNLHEYMFEFQSGSTPTTLTLPSNLAYGMKGAPTIKANTIYEFHIQQGKIAWEAYPVTT